MADANISRNPDPGDQENTLHALLAAIDRETAQELALDAASLKERAARNIRKKKPYIAFALGHDEMALPIGSVQEIGYLPPVTPLPNIPPWIRGIVQIRGEILSVVDCCLLFGIKEVGHHLRPSYVLFAHQDLKLCLMVDRIAGVVNVDERHDPLLPFTSEYGEHLSGLAPFFKGVHVAGERTVHILDDQKMGSSPLIVQWQ
ncbi:MAG: chemotaxis protein CheW [Desulfobulbus sp.]|jgi:purine-binding chemotaxis protein CheW|uniref:chemotaxis protein CheW n=1 Tax=Desulfobulbus sp. TaxID=895 RepID=UPI00284E5428|nr:chemotaxis protein CheW [Desulfobulbus sp.]MDR2549884.1 chemotaxis protein CheW [Desulfobulbus sp.]